MKIIPAIDIRFGQCIRLRQGDFNQMTVYEQRPFEVAKFYAEQGAKEIHIVDLDGAKEGILKQNQIITEIASTLPLTIQVGGGIRSAEQIVMLFEQGVFRVVIGTMAITHQEEVKNWLKKFGPERIVLALDVTINALNQPLLVSNGWQHQTALTMWELLETYAGSGLKYILCTDIGCDGVLGSPNFSLYEECLKRFPALYWQASGGVGTLQDLRLLNTLPLYGAIVGKAFYEKKITVEQALKVVSPC
jgi:phosphoribosylformimino-5-aminoimidazole carboxamide ribotide isomerase